VVSVVVAFQRCGSRSVGSVPSPLLRGREWTHIPADLAAAAYATTDPNYGVFDEERYFVAGGEAAIPAFRRQRSPSSSSGIREGTR
jgi:hypothetical protein